VKGAFTGPIRINAGYSRLRTREQFFLDEISEMSLTMQVKLLRVLQERMVLPVGGTNEIPIDVRVIGATNRDLDRQVAKILFAEDLYYRLSVIPVSVPPLRQRREDIRCWSITSSKVCARSREEHSTSECPLPRSAGKL